MSAGIFINAKYRASYGGELPIHPIKIQPELLDVDFPLLSNLEPSDPINNPISAVSSLGRRALGLHPRYVTIKRDPLGTPVPGYSENSTIRLVVLLPAVWDSVNIDDDVTYLGGSYKVISKTAELAN